MGSLFSSPGKQAQQAAQATGNIDQAMIGQMEGYVDTHQQQLRDAIAGLGPNPYFGAAPGTGAYKVDPANTVQAGPGALPPGLTPGGGTTQGTLAPGGGNPFAAPQQRSTLQAPPQQSMGTPPPQQHAPPRPPVTGGAPSGPTNPFMRRMVM